MKISESDLEPLSEYYKWDSQSELIKEILQNQKLRELMEKRLKECQNVYNDNTNSASHREHALQMGTTIQALLEASKK